MVPERLQAIIFDFDGVLVESADIKTRAFAELYADCGEDFAARVVAYHRANAGRSRYQKFRYIQETLLGRPPLTPDEERDLDRRFSKLVMEKVIAAPAVPGSEELLRCWHGRVPLFVASATPQEELLAIIERRGLVEFFDGVFGAPATKAESISAILAQYHLPPSRVLMIGDAMSDYEGARDNAILFLGRVAPGDANPFPAEVATVPDLRRFDTALTELSCACHAG